MKMRQENKKQNKTDKSTSEESFTTESALLLNADRESTRER